MLDRRLVLASLVASLLIAGALFVPLGLKAEPEEALEATATSGSIPGAIDAGVAGPLAGLLPTSESYQRAMTTIDGLKEGVPANAPTLSAAQLDDVRALAGGAVRGVLSVAPNTITTDTDRAALRALAAGYLRGALSELGMAPSAGRAAVDDAIATGVFAGAAGLLTGTEPVLLPGDYDAYGFQLASQAFDALDSHATQWSRAAGSPALADITFHTTTLLRGQLSTVPAGTTRAQLDAIATFAAGSLDGLALALVTGFPQGVPLPEKTDIDAWIGALATGHGGTPPWSRPSALPLLLAWADAVAASGIRAIDDAHDQITGISPEGRVAELSAWATGLAQGGYNRLDDVRTSAPGATQDLQAYAEALAAPGASYILERPHPNADVEAVTAWAFGLTGALEELTAGPTGGARYLSSYLGPLVAAVTDIPSDAAPGQTRLLLEFGEGATNALLLRLGNISRAVNAEEDPALIEAMASGLATGAISLLGGPALSNPQLAEALGDGLARGFLDSKDPKDLFADVDSLLLAGQAWFANGPPVGIVAIFDTGVAAVSDPFNAVTAFGAAYGAAPVTWAAHKGDGLTTEGFGTVADITWISAFGVATIQMVVPALLAPEGGLNQTQVNRSADAILDYTSNVTGSIDSFNITELRRNLTPTQVPAHARRVAEYLLLPIDLLGSPGAGGERAAARAMLVETIAHAKHLKEFKDAAYAQASIELVRGMLTGLKEGGAIVRQSAGDARPHGSLTPSWVKGTLAAVRDLPKQEAREDLSGRIAWMKATARAVPAVAGSATASQKAATVDFAHESLTWATGGPGRVPEPGTIDTPLLAWADATIATGLGSLPPVMTDDEMNATVAYLVGIQKAVEDMPALDVLHWSILDIDAITAYASGIATGADRIANDTHTYLCAAMHPGPPDCPDDNGGDGTPPCQTDCPEECDVDCDTSDWAASLQAWAEGLATAGLVQVERTDPTLAGIEIVRLWAAQTLAGHGICPSSEDRELTCDGPRGPVVDFANSRSRDVEAFAEAVGAGYGSLVEIEKFSPTILDPVTSPLLAYAAGLIDAMGADWLDPARPPSGPGGVPDSPVPLPGEDGLEAWSHAMWQAAPTLYDNVWPTFPDVSGTREMLVQVEYIFTEAIWKGGAAAIFEAALNASNTGANFLPNTGALDAFALGLVETVNATLVDPTQTDTLVMVNYYRGISEGGVSAILAAGRAIKTEQVPAIHDYAVFLGGALTPPLPLQPTSPENVTIPEREPAGNSSSDDDDPPSAYETYLMNLQAHAAGLAEAVLAAPVGDVVAFQGAMERYLMQIAAAGTALPPASLDAGFPVRLHDWTMAQAAAAMQLPTSADRIGPDPDQDLALAYVKGFAAMSPWSLTQALDGKLAWAASAIAAIQGTTCPPALTLDACAAIGLVLGEALGQGIPQAAHQIPLPAEADRLSFLQAVIQGAAPSIGDEPGPKEAQLILGLVTGLAPAGMGDPNTGDAAQATANAIASAIDEIPFVSVRPLAEELSAFLLSTDPARYRSVAAGTVALVVGLGDANGDPALVRQRVEDHLASGRSAGPTVTVTDGVRTRGGDALAGSAPFDAQRPITITVYPAGSSALGSTWELRWSANDPHGAGASVLAMTEDGGIHRAILSPAALQGLARGASVRFLLVESTPGSTTTHSRGGTPYAFLPDRDAPVSTPPIATVTGAHIALVWGGTDGDSRIASYHLETRDGSGAWTDWMLATQETSATFSGLAGHTYTFRATATDIVGHESAPAEGLAATVPVEAPINRAPSIAILSPVAGTAFTKTISVTLAATDPDGTIPMVRVCLRKETGSTDLACPYDGKPSDIVFTTSAFPDGRFRLHVIATDGTATAEALGAAFSIDRQPPAFRGVAADATPTRVVLTASLDPDATSVVAEVNGRSVSLQDDGKGSDGRAGDGIWSATTALAPGEYAILLRASDANGNEGTTTHKVVVPKASSALAGPGGATGGDQGAATGTDGGPGRDPASTDGTLPGGAPRPAPAKKGIPWIGPSSILVALAAIALARRRQAKR